MVNPIKSLYYQYFWWQRKQSGPYQGVAQWSALSFLVISIELYQATVIYLLLRFLPIDIYLIGNINKAMVGVLFIVLYYYLIYIKNWKRIVRNKKYNTMSQKIFAIFFPIFGLAFGMGSVLIVRYIKQFINIT